MGRCAPPLDILVKAISFFFMVFFTTLNTIICFKLKYLESLKKESERSRLKYLERSVEY